MGTQRRNAERNKTRGTVESRLCLQANPVVSLLQSILAPMAKSLRSSSVINIKRGQREQSRWRQDHSEGIGGDHDTTASSAEII
eukprot:scaffold59287_cov53-Attheya_sp.AAC.3